MDRSVVNLDFEHKQFIICEDSADDDVHKYFAKFLSAYKSAVFGQSKMGSVGNLKKVKLKNVQQVSKT